MKDQLKKAIRQWFRKRGFLIAKHPRIDYAQLSIFDLAVTLMMRTNGQALRFVQIGANDGVYGDSISRYSLKYPWTGILVEPQPDVFARLVENYRTAPGQHRFENIAIAGSHCTEITLWRPKPAADGTFDSTIASAQPGRAAAQTSGNREMESLRVACMTVAALLDKHQWTAVDLLLIDTEGLDYEILQTIDFEKTRPTMIQFEHGHLSPAEIDGALTLLKSNGYQIAYGGTQFDTIAIHQSAWARWQAMS